MRMSDTRASGSRGFAEWWRTDCGRREPRVVVEPTTIPVRFTVHPLGREPLDAEPRVGVILDLSRRGARMRGPVDTSRPLLDQHDPLRARVSLVIELPEGPVHLVAAVRWLRASTGPIRRGGHINCEFGLEFVGGERGGMRRLATFLIGQQIRARTGRFDRADLEQA